MLTLQKNDVFAERYLLKELIGTRGISEVWIAADLQENNAVAALKIFVPRGRMDNNTLEQLREDYLQIRDIHHPHLLGFHQFAVHDNTAYLVMPYMANGSLSQKLLAEGTLPEQEMARVILQIGSALDYLHKQQPPLLHRQIHPDNILLTENGDYVLADYGLRNRTRSSLYKAIGQTGSLTNAYTPPELFTAKPTANEAGDLFAFGVTLYELCSGETPWAGSGGLALQQGASVPYPSDTYAATLTNIIRSCMHPEWDKRPSAAEIAAEGEYFLQNNSWKSYGRFGIVKVTAVEYKKANPLKRAIVAAAAVLVLLAIGFFVYDNHFKAIEDNSLADTTTMSGDASLEAVNTGHVTDKVPEETSAPAPVAKATTRRTASTERAGTSAAANPAPEKRASPKSNAKKASTPVARPARKKERPSPKVSYPTPTSLENYLAQLQNGAIPIEVRERWKSNALQYFAPQAAVNYMVNNRLAGILSPAELVDILLSSDSTSTYRIGNTRTDESGKVEEISMHVQ
ncbi:serine/threonine-protein kinase [Pontibacter sp. SGAir0037]|uniref:serine/threonine protein kinase n=1 Tax=Pontibacter sp. SGAir0037 TaxID=2571030 RepID=UPI0010CCF6E0|nr:serine/threonine-protein kinase [Pontibacter sp. SGAir0037]QCR22696.1 hypothetical protein C1N53_10300 [Pontibacter sp. SGAir0037]